MAAARSIRPVPGPSRALWLALALAAATLAVYGQTVAFDFVIFDDDGYVFENARVRAGLSAENLRWAFTTGAMSNWHPLTWVSYLLDAELFGIDARGFHATNVALHLLNTLLLFGLLRSATGAEGRSALVAALFALHPLHVESVAWISERKDVLAGSFGLLCLWAYLGFARQGGAGRYATVAVLLALGLLAKPVLVTLPCVMLLLDIWPLGRLRLTQPPAQVMRAAGPLLIEKLPLFALAAAASVLTLAVQRRGGLVASSDWLPLAERAANALHAVGWYLAKTLWPFGLAVHYPHPSIPERGGEALAPAVVLAAGLLVAGLTGLVWRARARPWLLVGWFWFLGMLVPVSGLVQVSTQAHADRYSYLPSIGLFVAVVWAAAEGASRARLSGRTLLAAGVSAALACAVVSAAQVRHWRDSLALFEHAHRVVPEDTTVRLHLGMALHADGRVEAALPHYLEVVERDPGWPLARLQIALAYTELGQLAAAERHYRAAVRLTPDVAPVRANLAGVLLLRGELDEALYHYRQALERRPADAGIQLGLAGALARAGRLEEAAGAYRRALEIDPGHTEARVRLGHTLGALGRRDEAARELRLVLAQHPDHPAARAGLALAQGN